MPFALAGPLHSELLIKKSRFLACVEPASGREQAVERVAELRAEHPGARHVCWALMTGGYSAANDDGEPGATAGRPMLDVLRHQELEGMLATIVRYFGGIKLGAGGLARAHTDAVAPRSAAPEDTLRPRCGVTVETGGRNAQDERRAVSKRKKKDMSVAGKVGLGVAGAVQVALATAAFRDLARRRADDVRGPKPVWVPVILINWVGPAAYFVIGIKRP